MDQKGLSTRRPLAGEIRMHFISYGERTIAYELYRHGNSRISANLPNDEGVPYYFLIATGGGYVEGEHYLQNIILDDNTHAILTTQTPNYIYKCEHNQTTLQQCFLEVGENALCEYYFDETIPYQHALFHQLSEISLKDHAKLILTDGLTAGYEENDEPFSYHRIAIKTRIYRHKRLLLNDFLIVDPRFDEMKSLGYFEGYTNFNSVTIIDEDLDATKVESYRHILDELSSSSRYGLSLIESEGMVLRVLGLSGDENRRVMEALIRAYRSSLNLTPLNLRKGPHSMNI